MEELRELVKIIDGNKVKFLDIIHPDDGSKMSKLYGTVLSNPLISEDEAFLSIYKSAEENRTKFRQLKSRLEKKLINSLFIVDINKSSFNESNIAYYESFRYWAAVKILFQKRSYKVGLRLAEKLYAHSLKYELYEVTISIARDLRRVYGIERYNDSKYQKYRKAYDKYLPIYLIEIEAEEITAELHRIISKKTNYDYSFLSSKTAERLYVLASKNIDSFLFNKYFYVASIYHEQLNGNYEKIINICDTAIVYFKQKKYPTDVTLTVFYNRKIIALINTHNFKEALFLLEQTSNRSKIGSQNWHLSKILQFYAYMHNRQYYQAYDLYYVTTKKNKSQKTPQNIAEFWRIYNAYLQFLIVRGKLILKDSDINKFNIHKFVNDVPQYSKDKQGLSVAIRIIHFLFLLHLRRYSVIIDQMESLQQYSQRYLRRDSTFRSYCFFKMLIWIPRRNFVRKHVVKNTQKYWEKLQTAAVDVNNQQTTLEIIPYEHLWEMVLEMLD